MTPRTIWLTPAELDAVPVIELVRPLSALCNTREPEYGKCGWINPREAAGADAEPPVDKRLGACHNRRSARIPASEITPEIEQRICDLRREGKSYDAITMATNVSHRQVYQILTRLGLMRHRSAGEVAPEVEARANRDEWVLDLRRAGASHATIREVTGVSRTTLVRILNRNGMVNSVRRAKP